MQKDTKISLLKKNKIRKAIFYIYLALVLYGTLVPSEEIGTSFLSPYLFEGFDKVMHTLIFMGLMILWDYAYKLPYIIPIIIFLVLGLGIEILQGTMNLGRSFDLMDWLFDGIGIALGIIFIQLMKRINY